MKIYIGNATGKFRLLGPYEWLVLGPISTWRWRRVDVGEELDEDAFLFMI
jgi:hypothetical protein